jgi:hydroxyacyl-ACP dehydratase HTD2-like protein with hotdog domain
MIRRFNQVLLDEQLPERSWRVSRLTLFLFGVAYWTPHRVHYDVEFARSLGFADVLVTANLLSAYSAELLCDWAGSSAALRTLEERSIAPAVAGETIVGSGRVHSLDPSPGGGVVGCGLQLSTTSGRLIVQSKATVYLAN